MVHRGGDSMTGLYELAISQGAMFGGFFAIIIVSYLFFNAVLRDKSK